MRKAKSLVVVILIIVALSMTVLQVGASREIVVVDMNDIDYSHCANISPERASQIVNLIFGIADDATMIQPFSIWCIFGHSISTGAIITTQHMAYPTTPRCRETWTDIEFCNRCSHFVVVRESSTRRFCC